MTSLESLSGLFRVSVTSLEISKGRLEGPKFDEVTHSNTEAITLPPTIMQADHLPSCRGKWSKPGADCSTSMIVAGSVMTCVDYDVRSRSSGYGANSRIPGLTSVRCTTQTIQFSFQLPQVD